MTGRSLAGLLAVLLLLGACGKVGPVRPPGPQDQITHPRTYPNR
jgi:predicted small lipoprotein YifL